MGFEMLLPLLPRDLTSILPLIVQNKKLCLNDEYDRQAMQTQQYEAARALVCKLTERSLTYHHHTSFTNMALTHIWHISEVQQRQVHNNSMMSTFNNVHEEQLHYNSNNVLLQHTHDCLPMRWTATLRHTRYTRTCHRISVTMTGGPDSHDVKWSLRRWTHDPGHGNTTRPDDFSTKHVSTRTADWWIRRDDHGQLGLRHTNDSPSNATTATMSTTNTSVGHAGWMFIVTVLRTG